MAKTNLLSMKFLTLLFSILFLEAHASPSWTINDKKLLTIVFSSEHHNRIVIEEGRVEKVIYPLGYLDVEIEPICGSAYISSNMQTPETVTISLITENGLCQDVQLSFTNKHSEILVLSEKDSLTLGFDKSGTASHPVKDTVKSILEGCTPKGYYFRNFERKVLNAFKGVKKELVSILEGETDRVYVFRYYNNTKNVCELSEKDLIEYGTKWVYLGSRVLLPKEGSVAIVGIVKGASDD